MDKDDYFKILEEPCCYNFNNYLDDKSWATLIGLSHVSGGDVTQLPEKEVMKKNKIELNTFKYYEYFIYYKART
jgi:hypothetical protein